MAGSMLSAVRNAVLRFEETLFRAIFGHGFPPEPLCAIDCSATQPQISQPNWPSLKDILNNGFLWAVPTHRRTIEKRLSRRFGHPEYIWKPPVPKTNILMCVNCGHNYEAGLLCGNCYERVKLETEEMRDAIQKSLGLQPVEEHVVVIYEGEKEDKPDDFWKNQRVVELEKKRPEWFTKNLLESTTKESSDEKTVKPTDLA